MLGLHRAIPGAGTHHIQVIAYGNDADRRVGVDDMRQRFDGIQRRATREKVEHADAVSLAVGEGSPYLIWSSPASADLVNHTWNVLLVGQTFGGVRR
jgi:hypothetical protein